MSAPAFPSNWPMFRRPHCVSEGAVVRAAGWRGGRSWARRTRPPRVLQRGVSSPCRSCRGRRVTTAASIDSMRCSISPPALATARSCCRSVACRGRSRPPARRGRPRRRVVRATALIRGRRAARRRTAARARRAQVSAAPGAPAGGRTTRVHRGTFSVAPARAPPTLSALNTRYVQRRDRPGDGSRGGERHPGRGAAGRPRVLAMLSGGADSVCLLHVPRAAARRRTGGGAARQPRAAAGAGGGRALLRRAVRPARAWRWTSSGWRSPARGNIGGARARGALRARPSACAARHGWTCRHRAHGHRPGRDDPLPAGRLAGPPGAARHGSRAGAASSGRCWPCRRERDARVLRGGRPAVARGRDQPRPRASRATGCGSTSCRRCGRSIPAAERTSSPPRRSCARRQEVLERAVDEALRAAPAPAALPPAVEAARLRELSRRPLRRLVLRRLAEQAAGGPLPLSARARRGDRAPRRRAGGSGIARPRRRRAAVGRVRGPPLRGASRAAGAPRRRRRSPVPGHVPSSATGRSLGARLAAPAPATSARVDEPVLDARPPRAAPLTVRAWRDGDRMQPARPRTARSPSRTCSPTARCRARCAAPCRWSMSGRRDRLGGRGGGLGALQGRPGRTTAHGRPPRRRPAPRLTPAGCPSDRRLTTAVPMHTDR